MLTSTDTTLKLACRLLAPCSLALLRTSFPIRHLLKICLLTRQNSLSTPHFQLRVVRRLETVLLHDPTLAELDQFLAPGGGMETLVELQTQGVVGHVGLGCVEHEASRTTLSSCTAIASTSKVSQPAKKPKQLRAKPALSPPRIQPSTEASTHHQERLPATARGVQQEGTEACVKWNAGSKRTRVQQQRLALE